MKIVLMGCNHAGTWAAKTILKKKQSQDQLFIFDKNDNISFLGCGIALWVSGLIEDPQTLFYASLDEFKKLGAKVYVKHEIIKVDKEAKVVHVKNLENNQVFIQEYDKLIVASGSWPIIPNLEGIKLKGVMISKIYQHAQAIIKEIQNPAIKNVAIIGAGYIGVELAEAFDNHGKNVYLIEMQNQLTPNNFDPEIAQKLTDSLKEKTKINLHLGEKVLRFIGDDQNNLIAIETDKARIDVQMAIVSIGFQAQVVSLQDQVKIIPGQGIEVDQHFQTSDPDIYAIGDCISQKYNPAECLKPIMLATNAVRSGIVAGLNVLDHQSVVFNGIQGTNAIHVFGKTLAGTGLTEKQAHTVPIHQNQVGSILIEDYDKPVFIKDRQKVWFKVIYNTKTKQIIGAQIASEANHASVMYMLSLAIQQKITIDQLGLIDTYFLPHLNQPINFITRASLKYLNVVD